MKKIRQYIMCFGLLFLSLFLFPTSSMLHPVNHSNSTISKIPKNPLLNPENYISLNKKAMVVSEHALASKVGVEILKAGGNAVDAAVAIGYTLAVVQPCCGNLGGGGFMMIYLKESNKVIFINFREKAPLHATANMYQDDTGKVDAAKSKEGYLAVAVPGTVMGLETALDKYGTLPRKKLIAPAIHYAENGFKLTEADLKVMLPEMEALKKQPNVAKIFFRPGNLAFKVNDRLIQKDLANTLKLIQKNGTQAFYHGSIAEKIVTASEKHGGILSLKDFTEYEIEEQTPLQCSYHDYQLFLAPPPSSGGVVTCEILNILESYPLSTWGGNSSKSIHYILEAMRHAFLDRNQIGDPNFVENPVSYILSPQHIAGVQKKIHPNKATPSRELGDYFSKEGHNTSHYAVVDESGNIVAVTYTLNSLFGAKIIAGDTGFFLNNEMDDFTTDISTPNQFGLMQGKSNIIEPGKRPLSSMSPTLIFQNNQPIFVLGASGGPKIITSTLLTFINSVDFGLSIADSVNQPRFHHQFLPDEVAREEGAFSQDTENDLKNMGYRIIPAKNLGVENAIRIDPKQGTISGVSDYRRPTGMAAGY